MNEFGQKMGQLGSELGEQVGKAFDGAAPSEDDDYETIDGSESEE